MDVPSKLFSSIVKSTALYGAGIWGLLHAEPIEHVQQQFFKRVMKLPICTPRYFVRLETGQPHVSLEISKLGLSMLERILKSPSDSLLYDSYLALRRVSNIYPNYKHSWCFQMQNLLQSVGYQSIWNKNSANFLSICRSSVISKHRQNLRAVDLQLAKNSTTLPHYFSIISQSKSYHYLRQNLPTYLTTCIAQIRLNYSTIFNSGKWHDLSMFDERLCLLCGERESFSHIFECAQRLSLRAKILPPHLSSFDSVLSSVHSKINLLNIKQVYLFITIVLVHCKIDKTTNPTLFVIARAFIVIRT